MPSSPARRASNAVAMAAWLWLTWLVLSWTATIEQVTYGFVFAVALAIPLSGLGPVVPPWKLLHPMRLYGSARLAASYLRRMVMANVGLARRIWTPSLPLRSGMIVVDDPTTTPGARTALGLITSTVVDNQLIETREDPDRAMQYHGIWITSDDRQENAQRVFGPLPRWIEVVRRASTSHP